jgi:hypothetical protein
VIAALLWSASPVVGLGTVLVFFLIPGAVYAIVPYRRRKGHVIRLHEKGLYVTTPKSQQSFQFEAIDGVRVLAGRNKRAAEGMAEGLTSSIPVAGLVVALAKGAVGGMIEHSVPVHKLVDTSLDGYEFFIGEQRVFEIGPKYAQWKELGGTVFSEVSGRLIHETMARLDNGEFVSYKVVMGTMLKASVQLTLSREGLQVKDKPVIPWAYITKVEASNGYALLTTTNKKQKHISFMLSDGHNALVALQVIAARSEAAQQAAQS